MYDAPGSDAGEEWIEVSNLGSEPVDVGKYKFFENNTNHGLKVAAGSAALAPGASAVVADDAQKFLAAHGGFSGNLFDSTFSLSNTGEALALKDASSTMVDSVAYVAVEDANGTGGSLNLKDGSWVAALASPGVYPGPLSPVPKAPPKAAAAPAKKTPAAASAKTTSTKGSAATQTSQTSLNPASAQAASLSLVPEPSAGMLAWLGLAAVVLLGAAGALFLAQKREVTPLSADEFIIE